MHQGPGLGVLSRWVVLQRRSQQLLQDECSVWLEQQLCCNGIASWHLGVTPPEAPPAAWGLTRAMIRVVSTERVPK
jgi:hypothetical protein